jgi:hypothetical protein
LAGDKLYLDNILGMVELNNMVVTIDSVIDPNSFRININTLNYTTFTYVATSSYAKKYINGTENVTWEGLFYLPVRFKEDVLLTSFDNFNSFSANCTLVEIRLDEEDEHLLDD